MKLLPSLVLTGDQWTADFQFMQLKYLELKSLWSITAFTQLRNIFVVIKKLVMCRRGVLSKYFPLRQAQKQV